ncbi:MAG: hypothetical protein MRY63_08450 [Neomegalonema sp.]|nr:hypothetical protein [Neomegalonema sp.]
MAFFSRGSEASGFAELAVPAAWLELALDGYRLAFEQMGRDFVELAHPEIYTHPEFAPRAMLDTGSLDTGSLEGKAQSALSAVHFGFRGLGERAGAPSVFLRGIRNVLMLPLPPDPTEALGSWDALDHRLAKRSHALWVPNRPAAIALRAAGFAQAQHVPAPIWLPAAKPDALKGLLAWLHGHDAPVPLEQWLANAQQASEVQRPNRVFLSLIDPDAPKEELEALMRGFALHAAHHPQSRLLLAFSLDPDRRAAQHPAQIIGALTERLGPLACTQMAILPGPITEPLLAGLCEVSDFYLNTAEGLPQNFALQAAMLSGVVPVAPFLSGEASYLTRDNAIRVSEVTARAVSTACKEAVAVSPESFTALSGRAMDTAMARFSLPSAMHRIDLVLAGDSQTGLGAPGDDEILNGSAQRNSASGHHESLAQDYLTSKDLGTEHLAGEDIAAPPLGGTTGSPPLIARRDLRNEGSALCSHAPTAPFLGSARDPQAGPIDLDTDLDRVRDSILGRHHRGPARGRLA